MYYTADTGREDMALAALPDRLARLPLFTSIDYAAINSTFIGVWMRQPRPTGAPIVMDRMFVALRDPD